MTSLFNRRTALGLSGKAMACTAIASGIMPWQALAETSQAPEAKKPSTPPPPILAYAAPPLVDEISLSPNGKRVAMISQNGDDKQLIYFTVGSGEPKAIGLGPIKIRNLFWADDEHVVISSSQTVALPEFTGRQQEMSVAQILDLRDNSVRTLFDKMDNYYRIVIGGIHPAKINGKKVLIAANYRIGRDNAICLFSFDLDGTPGKLICEGSEDTLNFAIAPDGRAVAQARFDDEHKTWSLYYNTAKETNDTNFKLIYKVKQSLNLPSLVGLSSDGQSVVVCFRDDNEADQYHNISADGTIGPSLDTTDSPNTYPLFHPTTRRLAGFANSDDWVQYAYSDPLLKKIAESLPLMMGDDYRIYIVEYADDPRKVLLYGESAEDAGTYYFADLTTGALQILAQDYGQLPPEWITEKKTITYKAADGLEIHAYLTLPNRKTAANLPLIVLPHGGPQARDSIAFDWQTQALASRGYAVLQPNFRGSEGYGKKFIDAGHGEYGRKMQTDLSDGVRHLVSQGVIDPKRVSIMGASYGGYAALAGATLDPGVYNCAVSIAGVADMKSFIDFVATRTNSNWSSSVMYWKQYLGDPKTYDEISPAKQAAKASCPILLIHGTDDTVVPIEQSRRMESALKKANKPVQFITYKGQDHWETVGSSRIEMMKAAMTFLEKYNPA